MAIVLTLVVYLLLVPLVPVWRLFHRPRHPGACLGMIGISLICLVLIYYEPFRPPTYFPLRELLLSLLILLPIQLVLFVLAVTPQKEEQEGRQDSDRMSLTSSREFVLRTSNADKLKEP